MKKYIRILFFVFITCNAFAQDTIPKRERNFFKNLHLVNEFSRNIEHYSLTFNDFPFTGNKLGIAFISKKLKVESGFDLLKIISEDNSLLKTSAAFNILYPINKKNKWSLFLGASHLFNNTPKWDVTYEGKGFDGFVNYYYGIKLEPRNKKFHLLSLDLELLYGRFALAFNYAYYTTMFKRNMHLNGISRFCLSYYQPLYSIKSTEKFSDSLLTKTKNNFFLSFGIGNYLISHYEITASQGVRPPYSPRTEKNITFIRLPNAKIGITYFNNNFLQQISINGPFMLTAEYSLSYNLQPLFNNYKPSFTGLDVGFHINYFSLLGVERDVKTSLYSNMHLGIFHKNKKRLYYGIYNYSLLPNIYQTDRLAEYLRVNIELRIGYLLSVYKK